MMTMIMIDDFSGGFKGAVGAAAPPPQLASIFVSVNRILPYKRRKICVIQA